MSVADFCVWPRALAQELQEAFFAQVRREMASLVRDGKVIGEMTSNIIIASRLPEIRPVREPSTLERGPDLTAG